MPSQICANGEKTPHIALAIRCLGNGQAKCKSGEGHMTTSDVQTRRQRNRTHRRRRRFRWLWWVLPILGVLITAGILAATLFFQALSVRDDLTAMRSELQKVALHIKNGDDAAVDAAAANITELSARAKQTVDSPLWDVAARVPMVGANIEAVAETTKATDIIVDEALPSVLQLLATFDPASMKVEGGGINLQPFRDAVPLLPQLSQTFAKAQTHLDKIDRDKILPFVDENISQVVDLVAQTAPLMATGEKYLPTLLAVLGDGGTRTYAVMFQNNAEIRATGGNPGNAAILSITDGAVTMRTDPAVTAFTSLGYSGTGLPDIAPAEKSALFEWDTTDYVQNYSRFPEYADTASYMHQLWTKATGEQLNGVISLDPVALSYLLKVAGPVDVPGYGIQVTGENAAQVLMRDAYELLPGGGGGAQVFFDTAATAIFSKVMSGSWDPLAMIAALNRGVDEQRVYLSFVDPTEQAMAAEYGADGKIYTDTETTAQVGIYLNDAAYSKLEYYLTTSMNVSCDATARTVTTSISINNTLQTPNLSDYALGQRNWVFGLPRTTMMLDVLSFALPGGELVSVSPEASDFPEMDRWGNYNGLDARNTFVAVPMGESKTVSFTSSVPAGVNVPLTVRYSPTVTKTPVTVNESCSQLFPGTEVAAP